MKEDFEYNNNLMDTLYNVSETEQHSFNKKISTHP